MGKNKYSAININQQNGKVF